MGGMRERALRKSEMYKEGVGVTDLPDIWSSLMLFFTCPVK
jgi:hypothetical protein